MWAYYSTETVIPSKKKEKLPINSQPNRLKYPWVSGLIRTHTWADCHATQSDNQESSQGKYDGLFLNQNSPKADETTEDTTARPEDLA